MSSSSSALSFLVLCERMNKELCEYRIARIIVS